MFLRFVAANLLKKIRFSARHPYTASAVSTNVSPNSISRKLENSYWDQARACNWRIDSRDHRLWILIAGHVAMIIGINANPVLAKDASTETSSDYDTGRTETYGLHKVEDGSVVSNIHTSKWRVFTDKGREFFLQGKLDEAERLFISAIEEAKEGFGLNDPHVASACNNLAELYRVKKAFDKAEPLYREAIDILEKSFGPEDIRVAAAAHNLGQFFLAQRKLEEAGFCYEQALKIKWRVLGNAHSDCADTMYHLGVVRYLQGKETDAEVLILDSIRMLEDAGEGESIICIRRLRYLSQIYLKLHRLADAESVQRKILHILELSKGWNSLDTVIAAEGLALTFQASGNLKDSQELLERCLSARKALLPDDHIQIGANMLHQARVGLLICSQLQKLDISRANAELDKSKDHLHNSTRVARQALYKLLKQKDITKKHGTPVHALKEARAALVILMQSLSTLASVELAKQELQEGQEGRVNLEAREALLQCISAYREFKSQKSIIDAPEIKNELVSCVKLIRNFPQDGLDEAMKRILQHPDDEAPARILETS